MKKLISFAAMTALSLTLNAQSAFAAIDAAGAEALKKAVDESLNYHTEVTKAVGEGLTLGGATTVTPKDSYYEVTLPDVTVLSNRGGKIYIGTILANAVPGENNGYVVSMKLPSPIKIYDATNKQVAAIDIGQQKFAGVWRPDLSMMPVLDAEYKDVKITPLEKEVNGTDLEFTMGTVRGTMKLVENADKTWSGPSIFEASDLSLSTPGSDEGNISILKVSGKTTYDKVSLHQPEELKQKILATLKNPAAPTPEEQKALLEGIIQESSGVADGFSSNFELSGVSVDVKPTTDPNRAGKGVKEPFFMTMEKLTTGIEAKGMMQESGSVSMALNLKGLNIGNLPPEKAGVVPSDANVDILLDKLPMKKLGEAFANTLSGVVQTAFQPTATEQQQNDQIKMQAMMTAATLPQLLSTAGSTLTIKNTFSNAPDLSMTLDGSVAANATSPVVAVGVLNLVFTGIDELILKLQGLSQQPGVSPSIAGTAQMLAIAQMSGQAGTGANGKSTRTYKFEATPDGKMLMNGADMGMMMGGMMGGGNAPQPMPDTPPATP